MRVQFLLTGSGFFPASFIDVFDRSLLHGMLGFGVSGMQSVAHFLFEVTDGPQGDGHLENGLTDFLNAAFADVRAAAEVA
jgi:hypothetical protein